MPFTSLSADTLKLARPDARTPLLKMNRAERRQGLTRREREIALMAASGLSSRTIAVKLQLSVRTVSNHLAHVYAKFGVGSRVELAALLTTATADRLPDPSPRATSHR
jgi:DNA-binding CsgD family transcriptional regulator